MLSGLLTLLLPPNRAEPALAITISPAALCGGWPPKVLNGTCVGVLGSKSCPSLEPWWPHCIGYVVSTKSQNLQSSSLGRGMVEWVDIGAKVLVPLGMAQNRQPALMSLCSSPPLLNRHLFSLFSSPEICTFYIPPLPPFKEAAAAPAEGCDAVSTHPTSPKRIHAAADVPRDTPGTLFQALDPRGVAGVGWGWGTLTSVVGDRQQALAVLLLDGGCNGAMAEEKHLDGERADRGRVICAICCFPIPKCLLGSDLSLPLSKWVTLPKLHNGHVPFSGRFPMETVLIQAQVWGPALLFPTQ